MSTRIDRHEALEHPRRARLFDLIRQEPGIELHVLHERMRREDPQGGIAFQSIYHHLRRLEEFGFVTSRRAGRYRRFYENGGPQGSSATALSVLQNHPLPVIANLIVAHPGANQGDLWRRFREGHPCSRQTLGYHLRRLESHALAQWSRKGTAKNYYPTDTLTRLLPLAVRGEPSHAAQPAATP